MKLKFDSSQPYQQQAVSAIVNLFEGQPLNQGDFSITESRGFLGSVSQEELGLGNNLIIDNEVIYKNLCTIRENNDLDPIIQKEFEKNGLNFP